ncbi:hypothetical protein ACWELJ_00875 [Nocardia sp. NPDC004582]
MTFGPAVESLRKGGTTVVVAMYHKQVDLAPLMITEKTCTDGRIDPNPLITSTSDSTRC